MSKLVPAEVIKSCEDCPMRADGGNVEDMCTASQMRYIHSSEYDPGEEFPAWCPLQDI